MLEMFAPAIRAIAARTVCNNGIIKDVSIIFRSLFCAIFLRARLALAGVAVRAL
jgi:hypothetical protein